MKNALVLSGGSIRGAFQAGAIAYVLEKGFKPDGIYGTSVGSLNGGFLAERAGSSKTKEPDWPAIGKELENFWLTNITSFKKIGKKRGKLKLLCAIIRKKFDGFIDTKPLQKLVKQKFDPDNINNCPVIFKPCSVNIIDGKPCYAEKDQDKANILDHIIASTAIPITMPITMINNEPHLDGGIREVAPLKQAIDEGADNIICIVCQAKEIKGGKFNRKNIIELIDRLMSIVTNELVNNDLNTLEKINAYIIKSRKITKESILFADKRKIDLITIRPDETIDLNLEYFTADEIEKVIQAGRAKAAEKYPPPQDK